jgi:hypothetical protein
VGFVLAFCVSCQFGWLLVIFLHRTRTAIDQDCDFRRFAAAGLKPFSRQTAVKQERVTVESFISEIDTYINKTWIDRKYAFG